MYHQFRLVYASSTREWHLRLVLAGCHSFLFLACILFEVLLVNNDDQGFGVQIIFRHELLAFTQEVNAADLG